MPFLCAVLHLMLHQRAVRALLEMSEPQLWQFLMPERLAHDTY